MRKILLPLACLCLAAGLHFFLPCPENARAAEYSSGPSSEQATDPTRPLILYTAVTATTPQIPLWAAIEKGWAQGRKLDVRYWKNLDDLRGVILAGRGDIWLGNLEGFAQAAQRGAPVTLVAVTGWKKFYFLTTDPDVTDFDSLTRALQQKKAALTVTPADSPALGVLEEMRKRGGPSFDIHSAAPQQATLELLRGDIAYALLPEPTLSILLAKKPGLRRIASLEEEFARRFGGPARLPMIGIAVNTRLLDEEPELVRSLVSAMQEQAARLAADPTAALAVLPPEARDQAGAEILRASLAHDLILALPAWEVRPEIEAFLSMVAPGAAQNLPPRFIMPQGSAR